MEYEPNGYKVSNTKSHKYVTVRSCVIDETNFMIFRPTLRLVGMNEPKTSSDKTDITELSSKSMSVKGQHFGSSKSDNIKCDQILNNPTKIQLSEPDPIINNEHTEHALRRGNGLKGRTLGSYKEIDDDFFDNA